MRTQPFSFVLVLMAMATPARADFALVNADPPSIRKDAPNAVERRPALPAIPPPVRVTTQPLPPPQGGPARILHRPLFTTARGFGDAVPLAFAIRQMVPPVVKVTYGPGVDPNTLISWKGEGPWPTLLRTAIRPFGWHLAVGKRACLIARN